MQIDSSAAYATSINSLQTRNQVQTEQLRQNAEQQQQAINALTTGSTQNQGAPTQAAPTNGRGRIVDITA